jgi:hypothetical protein
MTRVKKAFDLYQRYTASAVVSPIAVELICWHVAIIVPTIGFKYLFVRRMSFTTGLGTILDSMGQGIERYTNLFLLATVDVLEVSLIVSALFVIGRLLLRIPSKTLIFTSVFLCLMIMGANQYSLLLVANLVSADTLAISTNWALEHPHVLWQSTSASEIGFCALAAGWALFFARLPEGHAKGHWLLQYLTAKSYLLFLKAILLISILGGLASSRMSQQFPLVLRGYWSSSIIAFFKLDTPSPTGSELPLLTQIQADYRSLVYPRGLAPQPRWLVTLPKNKLIPRHVLIVTLETAPRKFYPIIDNPKLPAFYEMSKHAVTSEHHYAMSPYTWWNNASILSGTYFVQKGKGIFDYGDFDTDSLASILAKRGYTTTFVESSKHGWGKTTGFWNNFGFTRLLDSDSDAIPFDRSSYSVTVDKEQQSFARAWDAIADAERRNTKAMVLLATTIGHYPWLAKTGAGDRTSEEKLYGIAALFDELLGELLKSMKQHGLQDQVLILVTGDHGFRMRTEFESVGLKAEHGDVAFNVPFLLYGPGLFDKQIRLPYVTSHVDIAPTLLALLGITDDSWLHHGGNMLDQRLRNRVTFMMNTNLSPVSGFRWNGCHYTLNDLTGTIQVTSTSDSVHSQAIEVSKCDQTSIVLSDEAVRSILETANRQFQTAFAYFQHRKARHTPQT